MSKIPGHYRQRVCSVLRVHLSNRFYGNDMKNIKVKELPRMFALLGVVENEAQFEEIRENLKNDMKNIRTEANNSEFELNRTYFLEVIASALTHLYVGETAIIKTETLISTTSDALRYFFDQKLKPFL